MSSTAIRTAVKLIVAGILTGAGMYLGKAAIRG